MSREHLWPWAVRHKFRIRDGGKQGWEVADGSIDGCTESLEARHEEAHGGSEADKMAFHRFMAEWLKSRLPMLGRGMWSRPEPAQQTGRACLQWNRRSLMLGRVSLWGCLIVRTRIRQILIGDPKQESRSLWVKISQETFATLCTFFGNCFDWMVTFSQTRSPNSLCAYSRSDEWSKLTTCAFAETQLCPTRIHSLFAQTLLIIVKRLLSSEREFTNWYWSDSYLLQVKRSHVGVGKIVQYIACMVRQVLWSQSCRTCTV